MRRFDLNDVGMGALGHEHLDVRRNNLIKRADQIPGWDRFPAGGPDGSAPALNVMGRCEVARSAACLVAMVLAKHEGYTSGLI